MVLTFLFQSTKIIRINRDVKEKAYTVKPILYLLHVLNYIILDLQIRLDIYGFK